MFYYEILHMSYFIHDMPMNGHAYPVEEVIFCLQRCHWYHILLQSNTYQPY